MAGERFRDLYRHRRVRYSKAGRRTLKQRILWKILEHHRAGQFAQRNRYARQYIRLFDRRALLNENYISELVLEARQTHR
jgi:hypothetical protein